MQQIGFPASPGAGDLDVRWIHGSESAKHNTDPDIQVHRYDEHTYVLRQNKAINYEAPFMFLMFGNTRALLLDTGATASPAYFPLRRTVDEIVDRWLADHPREDYGLVVAHTHGHGDHIAGDGQFRDRPHTVIVDPAPERVREFFGLGDDLDVLGSVDLGGRVLDAVASPGHHKAAVTFYDRATGLLLTGDTVYPGRLYVADWPAFSADHRPPGEVRRGPPPHPRARLPHRDDHHAGRGLPDPHHLSARRAAAPDDGGAPAADPRRGGGDRRTARRARLSRVHRLRVALRSRNAAACGSARRRTAWARR
ncbi:MBL fold metallo-hydrolase [Microbispora sp. SCL1-1]|nr:MBL fold metallo-hydrolase [Microbispora sp. CL1-1]TQS11406.1 MBL fold metallo-hydrolase [Microbispora sp. SCL1-1]